MRQEDDNESILCLLSSIVLSEVNFQPLQLYFHIRCLIAVSHCDMKLSLIVVQLHLLRLW